MAVCGNCGAKGAGADGLCRPCRIEKHEGPEAKREYLAELGRKGAAKTNARRKGLDTSDLPPLESPRAAEQWLAALAGAVLERRVSQKLASECRKIVKAWLTAHDRGTTSERLDELMAALSEWRRTGDPKPVLELVEGGGG